MEMGRIVRRWGWAKFGPLVGNDGQWRGKGDCGVGRVAPRLRCDLTQESAEGRTKLMLPRGCWFLVFGGDEASRASWERGKTRSRKRQSHGCAAILYAPWNRGRCKETRRGCFCSRQNRCRGLQSSTGCP